MKDEISIKRILNLHPSVRQPFSDFITDAETALNITIRVIQGLRTFAEQDAIYNHPYDGKDNDGDGKIDEADEHVSNAKAGQSYHNYGLAIDVAILDNGKINWNYDYKKLLPYAQKYGLEWGGLWKFKDMPHYQLTFGQDWRDLLAKHNSKDFISGTTFVTV